MTRRLQDDLLSAVHELDRRNLNRGSSGNCSVRVDVDEYLITPSGIPSLDVTTDMLVRMAVDGEESPSPTSKQAVTASSEWRFHRDIYRARPEIGAVVHVHSTFATSLSCLRCGIPSFHYMVAVAGGEDIRCAPYATYGTSELSSHVVAALHARWACLMANHGMITIGNSIAEALDLCIEVEALAEQYMNCLAVGEPVLLDRAQMAEVINKFGSYRRLRDVVAK